MNLRAPLKYEGLQPWEVLVSEAQERMTLAVQPEQRVAFEALAKQRDVEVAFMGTFNDSGYFTVKQEGVVVASLDMNFLYEDGCPTLDMPAVWKAPTVEAPVVPETADFSEVILSLLSDLNLCSREYKSRMCDGEVKGLSVVKRLRIGQMFRQMRRCCGSITRVIEELFWQRDQPVVFTSILMR